MPPVLALAGPLPELGAVAAVLLVAAALVVRDPHRRALAMGGALLLAPVLLLTDIWDSPQLEAMRDSPLLAATAAALAAALVAALAVLIARRPAALPLLAIAALPFRVPIEVGGATSNLLVPLYLVIAGGALAAIVPRLRAAGGREEDRMPSPGWLERMLALAIVLYGVQATYSEDFDKALQQIAFFVVPFGLLFLLLVEVRWSGRLLAQALGLLVGLALVFSAIGYVEYATKHIFLNPKLIASNDLHTYFRTNSVFFDPNIYGRFLVVAMLAVTATMLHATRARLVGGGAVVLVALWAGLVLTLSQSSLAALLAGLATLAALRWGTRRTLLPAAGVVLAGAAIVLATPSSFGLSLDNLDSSSGGRTPLVRGGVELFAERPVAGHGSGSFERAYRLRERPRGGEAPTASHTIPVTVAAEQGIVGLLAYLALLAAALARLLRGAAASPARAAVAAAFVALVVHTLVYAAFLEDPLTWTLLAVGTALAAAAPSTGDFPRYSPQKSPVLASGASGSGVS
jgi:putative inorganic carbon (HCO3(-)) transporter